MDVKAKIPTAIFRALRAGAGRVKIQKDFEIPAHLARHYVYIADSFTEKRPQIALILADLHIPYHDTAALSAALTYGEALQPDTLVLLGDAMDFEKVSFWKSDPSRMRFADEVALGNAELRRIESRFPTARKVFVLGNHEFRLTSYLWSNADELAGLEALAIPELLHLREHGWEYIDNKQRLESGQEPFRLGNTYLIHGHEVRCSMNVVSIPRIYYSKVHGPVIAAHHHITQEWNARCLNGDFHHSYSVGCLCNLSPPYNPVNNWNWGLATLAYTDTAAVIENKKIIDGQVV